MTLTPDASNNSSPAPNSNTLLNFTLPSTTVLIHASSVVSKAPPSYLITYTKLNNSAYDIVLSYKDKIGKFNKIPKKCYKKILETLRHPSPK